MKYDIGNTFQFSASGLLAFAVTCSDLTEHQFRFLSSAIDAESFDTYPDIENRRVLVVTDSADADEFRDMIAEQVVGKFIRRCCDPASSQFIPDDEYTLLMA